MILRICSRLDLWTKKMRSLAWTAMLGLGMALGVGLSAAKEPLPEEELPSVLLLEEAVDFALRNNPELIAFRQQRGIAEAGVVISRTYPFNPTLESKIRSADGPPAAGVTNHLDNEHKLAIDVEIFGQARERRQAALAGLSRTDWEIAFQELTVAVRVTRAFNAVLYRQGKLNLLQETYSLNQKAADQVGKLVEQAKLRPADLIVARSEVDDTLAQIAPSESALTAAQYDLRRALGVIRGKFSVRGVLALGSDLKNKEILVEAARAQRPDLHAKEAAVSEAEARLRLETRNRYGNPNMGPVYEYDSSRINFIGAQIILPLPLLNTHQGEILQRRGERDKAALEFQALEKQVHLDVESAIERYRHARRGAGTYREKVLPNLQKSRESMEKLLTEGDPGVDILKVLDVRRKLLKARDGYLDALNELSQAQADLAAALGQPLFHDSTSNK